MFKLIKVVIFNFSWPIEAYAWEVQTEYSVSIFLWNKNRNIKCVVCK